MGFVSRQAGIVNLNKTEPVRAAKSVNALQRENIQNKNGMSMPEKTLLGLAAIGIAALGAISGVHNPSSLKNVQKSFQKVFMRDDITLGETKVMLDRYKQIEKIKDNDEYIRQMFNEAAKNYGLDKFNIKLFLRDNIRNEFGMRTNGEAYGSFMGVSVLKTQRRETVANTVHHELRHWLQNYYSFNLNPEQYVKGLANRIKIPKSLSEKDLQDVLDSQMNDIIERIGKPSIKNVPDDKLEFAQKCLNGHCNYTDAFENKKAYFSNFVERDAYFAGDTIEKILKRNNI